MAVTDERVSRRKLLKRAGVGAAVLGAGAMATAGTASAAYGPSSACATLGGCGDCGYQPDAPGGSGCCFCSVTVEGTCVTIEDFYCDDRLACTSSKGCPPGWACVVSCCNDAGYGNQCAPHCGAVNAHIVCAGGLRPTSPKGATARSR